jgi:hypothetical protein
MQVIWQLWQLLRRNVTQQLPLKTLSRNRVIQVTRSIADIDIGRLGVSNMMLISMIAAPAPCQEKSLAERQFLSDFGWHGGRAWYSAVFEPRYEFLGVQARHQVFVDA